MRSFLLFPAFVHYRPDIWRHRQELQVGTRKHLTTKCIHTVHSAHVFTYLCLSQERAELYEVCQGRVEWKCCQLASSEENNVVVFFYIL